MGLYHNPDILIESHEKSLETPIPPPSSARRPAAIRLRDHKTKTLH